VVSNTQYGQQHTSGQSSRPRRSMRNTS
jgi:hypothetical protein